MNGQHGDGQMSKSKKKKKFCIVETNYKHFQGGHGRLKSSDVYTCHGLHSTLFILLLNFFS
jgi:hypothetical protein